MRPPRFSFDLTVEGSPAEVWSRLWDLDRHTAAVPLTTASGGPLDLGTRFVARTALGPVGFDDVMVVRVWDPPQRAVVEKVGGVLHGAIEVTLEPVGAGTRVRWSQSYGATRVPLALARVAAPAVRAAYRRAVRAITRA